MKLIFLFLFLVPIVSYADEEAIPLKNIVTQFPQSSDRAARKAFRKEALPYWAVIGASTGILYHYDEKISSNVRYHADNWHIGRKYRSHSSLGKLVKFPQDIGSFLYFSGDGFIHIATAGAFIATGKLSNNNYAANTGIMMLHGFTMTGIYDQVLKRSFGRESPVEKTQPRGAWHPFPSFHKYQSNTAKYDAMPSGHIMTATLTFTVLANRYEKYAVPITCLGVAWVGALGFQMINNGVHWSSDYPLGIAMGYLIGKSVIDMNKPVKEEVASNKMNWTVYPSVTMGAPGLNAFATF